MGRPMDYNDFAKTYAETRSAFPVITNFLVNELEKLKPYSVIIEIGCGTANYLIDIMNNLPGNIYKGFDLSKEMLKIAKSKTDKAELTLANADENFPYPDKSADAAYLVDVIHHIVDYNNFFKECNRILKPAGKLLIVTDTQKDFYKRSGTKYFPETLSVELERYPELSHLNQCAISHSLLLKRIKHLEQASEIDDDLISKIEKKRSSSLRLIPEKAFREGLERIRKAKLKGEKWLSSYTVLKYQKLNY
jgi:ubiquinone/menaquinone biosynthesis C-methylase UbiE